MTVRRSPKRRPRRPSSLWRDGEPLWVGGLRVLGALAGWFAFVGLFAGALMLAGVRR